MVRVLYPGSFNPITKGHRQIINQASELFDEVVVAVMCNPNKPTGMFTIDERVAMIKELYKDVDNVKVVSSTGATVDVAKENGCKIIIRGIRNYTDYDFESGMQQINYEISNGEVRTVILFADKEYQHISSSIVRELFNIGKDFSDYVDPLVKEKMMVKKLGGK
jgi:pantetheine-phosphate adenylyltransferase